MNLSNIDFEINVNPFPIVGIFAIAKIFGYFPLSWWWVISPIWIPIAFAILVMNLTFIILAIVSVLEYLTNGKG